MKLGYNGNTLSTTWRRINVRQLGPTAAAAAILAAAGIIGSGVFDAQAPATTALTPPSPPITVPRDSLEATPPSYYLVESQAEAEAWRSAISGAEALLDPSALTAASHSVIDAGTPEGEQTANALTSAAWSSELGHDVTVVDLRATSAGPSAAGAAPAGGLDSGTPKHRMLTDYLVDTRAEASALHTTLAGEALLMDPSSLAALSYSVLVVDSAQAKKDASELLAIAGNELGKPGVNYRVIDLRQ